MSLAGQPVITYAFKTSADGSEWTAEQKSSAYAAINCLDGVLPLQSFVESNDFTVRWGGADFFKDWRSKDANGNPSGTYSAPGWDFTGILACAYKHNNGPWDANLYPNNEIYINQNQPWNFDANGPAPGKYDLYTVLLHEIIHMLACDAHAGDPNEVMYETVELGVRKDLQESDLQILRNAGYLVVPEPVSAVLLVSGGLMLWVRRRKYQR